MEVLRDIKYRMILSGITGMLVCVLVLGGEVQRMPLAWWGILYPEYCFMEVENSEDESKGESEDKLEETDRREVSEAERMDFFEEQERGGKIKISFWLAKVFDW